MTIALTPSGAGAWSGALARRGCALDQGSIVWRRGPREPSERGFRQESETPLAKRAFNRQNAWHGSQPPGYECDPHRIRDGTLGLGLHARPLVGSGHPGRHGDRHLAAARGRRGGRYGPGAAWDDIPVAAPGHRLRWCGARPVWRGAGVGRRADRCLGVAPGWPPGPTPGPPSGGPGWRWRRRGALVIAESETWLYICAWM